MPKALPHARDLFGGENGLYDDAGRLQKSASKLVSKKEALVEEVTKATIEGLSGATQFVGSHETGSPLVKTYRTSTRKADPAALVAKGFTPELAAALATQLRGINPDALAKEWTLGTPLTTGLVPFDLEQAAKLLTPRPTPLHNTTPRVKGQGAARRFKVISGFTGTGTGGATTLQPGITESTTNTGPGGLSYIRPPYISYDGYDVTLPYVSWGLSDSVSWQAEYQGQGFEDIRSLSNTALLFSTMLMEERLMLYGRGSAVGYAGALGTPASVTAASVSGGSLSAGTYWFVLGADAGDLLGTTGAVHQGPTTAAASVAVGAGGAISASVGADVTGALGYNIFVASVQAGPFFYAGRSGYNVVTADTAPTNTASVAASAADASAVATNFDGMLTNIAASGGYVKRLNSTFNTSTPGVEFQDAFSSLYDAVKADPDDIWLNGHDRNQLSNALLAGNNVNNYTIYIPDATVAAPGAKIGAIVQSVVNQITGKELSLNVHPWLPQGNAMVRSLTLPIPDSNVSDCFAMALPQDYVAVQWPVQQFTYDSSTLCIGTLCSYAPAWQALIGGIVQDG